MDTTLIKVQCEECGRTKIVNTEWLTEADADLLAAESGDVVERKCPRCDEWTEHTVLGVPE